jgi:hypothetical protein
VTAWLCGARLTTDPHLGDIAEMGIGFVLSDWETLTVF